MGTGKNIIIKKAVYRYRLDMCILIHNNKIQLNVQIVNGGREKKPNFKSKMALVVIVINQHISRSNFIAF